MTDDLRTIAAGFDERAANYSKSEWHREYAERLVALAPLEPGHLVLDTGAGTGFAAIPLALRVGPSGRVVAVDISAGMLDQARRAIDAAGIARVELMLGDATDLEQFPESSFDAVICSSALLYMPVAQALGEWHRLLKPDGVIGFSTMCVGSPPAGRLFRECAAQQFGLRLSDPSASLGSSERCKAALDAAGFVDARVIPDELYLTAADLALSWESNVRSAAHAPVRELSQSDQEILRGQYELALRRAQDEDERSLCRTHVLYAFGRKT